MAPPSGGELTPHPYLRSVTSVVDGTRPTRPSTLTWRAYLRHFDIEHTFRFAKNTLG